MLCCGSQRPCDRSHGFAGHQWLPNHHRISPTGGKLVQLRRISHPRKCDLDDGGRQPRRDFRKRDPALGNGLKIPGVDPNDGGAGLHGPIRLLGVANLDQGLHS